MLHSPKHRSAIAAAVVAATLAAPAGASAGNGVISGTVVDEDEYEPIANARVATSRTRGGMDIETRTDAEGKYTIGGLEDGIYDVAFLPPEGSNFVMEWYSDSWDWGASSSVVIANGEPAFASADLAIGATISGRVSTKSGGPAAKACVNALALDRSGGIFRSGGKATTDSAGNYKIVGLAPGVYKLWFGPVEAAHGRCEGGARGAGFEETWLGGGSDFWSADPTKVISEEEREGVDAIVATRKDDTTTVTPEPTTQADGCVVPKLRGLTLTAARKALTVARCKLGKRTRRTDPKVKRGRVVASKPKIGTSLPAGSKVDLVVSKGPARKR